jgi:NTP pyrophosphatase (non-canonical NTP hydrolase)
MTMKTPATLTTLRDALRRFADERDWNRYHSPKNLAISVSLEAAELLEHFQWTDQIEPQQKEEIGHEMADVLLYLVRLADRLDIDLLEAATRKIELNAKKYPATSREIRK